jgi:cytochrome c-type biogenesis protein CcmH
MSLRARAEPASAPTPRRRRPLALIVLASALMAAAAALALVAFSAPDPTGSPQEQVQAVGETLRCPVCQNLSVADSPSRTAQQMREQIAAGLKSGRTPDQIRAEFVAAYGEWILLAPPKKGIDLLAWIGPAALLLGGLVVALLALRRWTSAGVHSRPEDQSEPLSAEDRRLLERALASHGEDFR